MSIQYIEIDTVQLNEDINELREKILRTRSALSNMQSEFEELNSMWTGRANTVFRSQVAKDCNLMDSVLDTMGKLAECMENAKSEYVRCEQSVKNTVNSIRI